MKEKKMTAQVQESPTWAFSDQSTIQFPAPVGDLLTATELMREEQREAMEESETFGPWWEGLEQGSGKIRLTITAGTYSWFEEISYTDFPSTLAALEGVQETLREYIKVRIQNDTAFNVWWNAQTSGSAYATSVFALPEGFGQGL